MTAGVSSLRTDPFPDREGAPEDSLYPEGGDAARELGAHTADIVARIREGDTRLFELVYHTYAPRTYRFAYAILRNRAAAEEVVQDIFLSIWQRRATLDIQGRLDIYLYVAARNRARNVVRKERMANDIESRHLDGQKPLAMGTPPQPPDRVMDTADLRVAVDLAVAQLPERRRVAFLLRWKERLGYADIARAMGISVEAAQMHVARARNALRQMIEPLL